MPEPTPRIEDSETAPRRTLLTTLVSEYKLLVVTVVAIVTAAPELISAPLVTRHQVHVVELTALTIVVLAHFNVPRPLLRVVFGLGIAAVVALAFVGPPGEPDQRAIADVSSAPAVLVDAFDHAWVMHETGVISRLSSGNRVEAKYHVSGPATDMVECGGALLISHADGALARMGPVRGRVVVDRRYGKQSGNVSCSGGFAFVTRPADGTVLQLRPKSLKAVAAYDIGSEATSITSGDGVLWVLDGAAGEIVGVLYKSKRKTRLGPYRVDPGATQILYANGYLWLLYPEDSCLRRLDAKRKTEIAPPIALGPAPTRMHAAGGMILVADGKDGSVVKVDTDEGRAVETPVMLGGEAKLADAVEQRDRLVVVDSAHDRVTRLSATQQLAQRRGKPYLASKGCRP